MTVDERGNLWATGPGGVHVLSPSGHEIGLIAHEKPISNCTFGGVDGRMLFMTASHQVLALETNVHGAPVRMPVILGRRSKP
jgi:gluconolactonase